MFTDGNYNNYAVFVQRIVFFLPPWQECIYKEKIKQHSKIEFSKMLALNSNSIFAEVQTLI